MNERNSNVELLRILSMLMVLVHHVCGQVFGYQFYTTGEGSFLPVSNWLPIILIESFVIVAVNIFILISGYYSIKLRLVSLLKMLLICLFFLLFHNLVLSLAFNEDFNFREICFPISSNTAWFIQCYFMLMLISPLLNKIFVNIKIKDAIFIVVVLFCINVYFGFIKHGNINEYGYTLSQMIMMYSLGRIICIYKISKIFSIKIWFSLYVLFSIMLFLLIVKASSYNIENGFWLLAYNNPLIIVSSISVFCVFINRIYVNSQINYLSKGVLGIYLLHAYRPIWFNYIVPFLQDSYKDGNRFFYILILSIILLFALGIFLNILFNYLITSIMNIPFLRKYIDKFNVCINISC